jgi:hypothetical protein
MRWIWVCIGLAAITHMASGQQTAGGQIALGAITQQIAFVDVSNSPAGATNATGNNLAGARNSTVGNVPGVSFASTTVPVYMPLPLPPESNISGSYDETPSVDSRQTAVLGLGSMRTFSAYSNWPDSLADMARAARQAQPPRNSPRVYTNSDLERLAWQFFRSGNPALSTVQNTSATDPAAIAAQQALDRNLGVRSSREF